MQTKVEFDGMELKFFFSFSMYKKMGLYSSSRDASWWLTRYTGQQKIFSKKPEIFKYLFKIKHQHIYEKLLKY